MAASTSPVLFYIEVNRGCHVGQWHDPLSPNKGPCRIVRRDQKACDPSNLTGGTAELASRLLSFRKSGEGLLASLRLGCLAPWRRGLAPALGPIRVFLPTKEDAEWGAQGHQDSRGTRTPGAPWPCRPPSLPTGPAAKASVGSAREIRNNATLQ